jgi:hypothetical protein
MWCTMKFSVADATKLNCYFFLFLMVMLVFQNGLSGYLSPILKGNVKSYLYVLSILGFLGTYG